MKKITGQIHCRMAGKSVRPGSEETHDLVTVVGILSIPKGIVIDDQMLTLVGSPAGGAIQLTAIDEGARYDSHGDSQGHLLLQAIWRV